MTFDPVAFTSWALARLAEPPPLERIERHDGRGAVVLRFALPLELAAPLNRSRHATGWQAAKHRSAVYGAMRTQLLGVPRPPVTPLPGRPMFRAVRFSSVEPDSTAGWWKVCGDVLLRSRLRARKVVHGLGLLEDDRPSKLEVRAWWEPAPRGAGGVLIEIWSGGAE